MTKALLLLTLVAFGALTFAFLYQPRDARRGRFHALTRRIRLVAYAYVAAILISAAIHAGLLERLFGWGD
jgi:hypothetical protein